MYLNKILNEGRVRISI